MESDDLDELLALVREMHKAEDEYGCGFYNHETWLKPYYRLRMLAGMPYDPEFPEQEYPVWVDADD